MSYTELTTIKEQWKAATDNGNQLFNQLHFKDAEVNYARAMALCIILLENIDTAEHYQVEVISAFFISCTNLSNTYHELGNLKIAGDYLFYNVFKLKALCGNSAINEQSKILATKNWHRAVLALTEFYRQTGQPLEINFWQEEAYERIKAARQLIVRSLANLN